MSDYTIGIAERIASLPDSTATANSVNRNYFQETSQSVVNTVNVAIVPAAPTALDPTPQTTYATATDEDSVETFGVQETPIVITLLATIEDAGALAQYLIRSVPAYWFSNLAVSLNTLSEANKNIVANLEIGQQIAVTKTFPAGVVPQTVTEYLFVEGISHNVTVDNHIVTIYTGPASTFLQWTLSNFATTTTRTNFVPNPSFETNLSTWSNVGFSAFARITTDSYSGIACARGTKTTGRNEWILVYSTPVPVVPGSSYTVSAYFKVPTGNESMNAGIRTLWYTSAGVQIGGFNNGTYATLTNADGWQRRTFTGVAPANAAFLASYYGQTTGGTAGQQFLLDAVLIEQSSSALPYFDGSYADAYTDYTLISQQWNGTANASTSTGVWGLNSSDTGSPLNDSTYGLA